MSGLWAEKYRPKVISDLYISSEKIDVINEWISNYGITKKALLLIGPPGLGKTTLARIIFTGYDVIEYNASDIRTQALINKAISDIVNLSNVGKNKRAVIMDEIDGMLSTDKKGLDELISFIKNTGSFEPTPFILISNIENMKQAMLQTLFKNCVEIFFDEPDKADYLDYIAKIWRLEFIAGLSDEILEELYQIGQCDYRRIINFMEYLKYSTDDYIDLKHIRKLKKIYFGIKDNMNVSQSILKIMLSKSIDYAKIMNIYYYNRSKINSIIYENYYRYADSISNAVKLIDCLINSDLIERLIYETQTWNLLQEHGRFSLYLPILYFSGDIKINVKKLDSSKAFIQNNKKKVLEVLENIRYKTIVQIVDVKLFAELILYLICKKKYVVVVTLMEYYNFYDIDLLSGITGITYFKEYWTKIISKEESAIILKLIKSAQMAMPLPLQSYVPIKKKINTSAPVAISQTSQTSQTLLPSTQIKIIPKLKTIKKEIQVSTEIIPTSAILQLKASTQITQISPITPITPISPITITPIPTKPREEIKPLINGTVKRILKVIKKIDN
jgi:DNA polymerase III delta prime subunit